MTEDFVTKLKVQLKDAAEREARRGPLGRAARTARVNGTRPALALAAAAVLAALVFVGAGRLSRPAPEPSGPRLVAHLSLASQGGGLAPGFGAVWATDPAAGAVLKVAPNTGRVVSRIPTGGQPHAIATGAGAVWAFDFQRGRLLRIDPETSRVTARLPLGLPPRSEATVLATFGDSVWIGDGARALRIDPSGERITRRVSLRSGGLEARVATANERQFFVLGLDGRLTTFDGHTGARLSSVVLRPPAQGLGAAGRYVVGGANETLLAYDPATGRAAWRRPLRAQLLDYTHLFGATLWVHGGDRSGRDGLWRIDFNTGRITGTLALPEFGATAMTVVGDRLWVFTPGGKLEIVSGS